MLGKIIALMVIVILVALGGFYINQNDDINKISIAAFNVGDETISSNTVTYELHQDWNRLTISHYLDDKILSQVKGDCVITQSYTYTPDPKKNMDWTLIDADNHTLAQGENILVKVNKACYFSTEK